MPDLVVGVDGGNSKTDLVLADTEGRLLSWVRGAGTRPHTEGMETTTERLARLGRHALAQAGLPATTPVSVGAYFLANVDRRAEEQQAERLLTASEVAARVVVHNDTLAVLRAGAPDGWGVAVVSGAGINAAAVHPSGRSARFLSLGDITGDWGGGLAVARAGLGAAVRAGDGRGPATRLRQELPVHFGLASVESVALAVGAGRIPVTALHGLTPLVFGAAESGDAVARGIVERLGDEIVSMVTALLRRLRLLRTPTPVVLGGGTLQNAHLLLRDHIGARLSAEAPLARPRVLDVAPVAGAVAQALETAGAAIDVQDRLRKSIADRRPPETVAGALL
ncbi:BadF/BadG/BcrA/BcrD ATPase family protein [Streptomyces sp. SID13726]|uniref:N-acetylglucosamine kinase n=1 Tax=Streptomyces sp. SID13726 TaxID=2706058 RepID=UPI0013BA7F1E|nr:BadF/BadG/BcrA/BcrD ATPase family protein [Streptomyces sp. SID13726]NEA99594.1 ATPase [Streptomyces sp. SID13726]